VTYKYENFPQSTSRATAPTQKVDSGGAGNNSEQLSHNAEAVGAHRQYR